MRDLVVLILDYYGLDGSFKSHLPDQQKDWNVRLIAIQDRLEQDINNPRFRFRLQVHEFEAYLFSEPEVVADHFGKSEKLAELNTILDNFGNDPEAINDDPQNAPSKRLSLIFPTFSKGKTSDGLLIAQKTGVAAIRGKCRRFDQLCGLFDEMG